MQGLKYFLKNRIKVFFILFSLLIVYFTLIPNAYGWIEITQDLDGPTKGLIDISYDYSITAISTNTDTLKYIFHWGTEPETTYEVEESTGTVVWAGNTWEEAGTYYVWVEVIDSENNYSSVSSDLKVEIRSNNETPVLSSGPTGPTNCTVDKTYTYTAIASDFENDDIQYEFEFFDIDKSIATRKTVFYASGETGSIDFIWTNVGTYFVKVRAIDDLGAVSDWSNSLTVSVVTNENPPSEPSLNGPEYGVVGMNLAYAISSTDPDGDIITHSIDWGDGVQETYSNPSGKPITISHIWIKDCYDLVGDLYQLTVTPSDPYGNIGTSVTMGVEITDAPYKPSSNMPYGIGSIGGAYSFSTIYYSTFGKNIKYIFEWGDGSSDTETDYVVSGSSITVGHIFSSTGTFDIVCWAKDIDGYESYESKPLTIEIIDNDLPDVPNTPSGHTEITAQTNYSYTTSTTDPDGDQVKYIFDWGDGTTTETEYLDSGVEVTAQHKWLKEGTYQVKVKAIDSNMLESGYSLSLTVNVESGVNVSISETDISLSNQNPVVGDTVTITATIRDNGTIPASQTWIYFYDGNPNEEGKLIAKREISFAYEYGGYRTETYENYQTQFGGDIQPKIQETELFYPQVYRLWDSEGNYIINVTGNNATGMDTVEDDCVKVECEEWNNVDYFIITKHTNYITLKSEVHSSFLTSEGKLKVKVTIWGRRPRGEGGAPPPPETIDVKAQWNTSGLDIGTHNIYVVVKNLETDLVPADNVAIKPIALYTDLSTSSENITFSNSTPVEGEQVTVTAKVSNNPSSLRVPNVKVGFYDGNPAGGGSLISEERLDVGEYESEHMWYWANGHRYNVIGHFRYNSNDNFPPGVGRPPNYTHEEWDVAGGDNIYFSVSQTVKINIGGSLGGGTVYINKGTDATGLCTQRINYDGIGPSGDYIDLEPGYYSFLLLGPSGTGSLPGAWIEVTPVAQTVWDTTGKTGTHNIYVVVDPDNQISDYPRTNNIAYKSIEVFDVLDTPASLIVPHGKSYTIHGSHTYTDSIQIDGTLYVTPYNGTGDTGTLEITAPSILVNGSIDVTARGYSMGQGYI